MLNLGGALLLVALSFATSPAVASVASGAPSDGGVVDKRPYRLGVMTLAPELDKIKPLAAADAAGWVIASDVLIGPVDEKWVAGISLADRRVLWWFQTETPLSSPPTSIGSWVVLGERSGKVHKVETLTGKKVWEGALDTFTERPFVLSGTTLLALSAAQVLTAIDFQSGKTLWIHDGGFPEGLTVRGAPAAIVNDGKAYMGLASGEIVAVNVATGQQQWRVNPSFSEARFHDVVGELVVRGGRLLLARYDGLVAALDLTSSDGRKIWEEKLPSVTTTVFRNGRYYVGCLNGDVYAFDGESGRRIWRVVTGAPVAAIGAGESLLFVASSTGRITALDAASGGERWVDDIGGDIATAPMFYQDMVIFATGLKNLYSYKAK